MIFIAETDEQARAESVDLWAQGSLTSSIPDKASAMITAGAAMAGIPKGAPLGDPKPPMGGEPWMGSPETVLEQIREAERHIGMGRAEFPLGGSLGSAKHSPAALVRSIKLIGQEIIPALHAC